MKRSIKYPKIDGWYYTSTKKSGRKKIKRNHNKSIRNKEKTKLRYIMLKIK